MEDFYFLLEALCMLNFIYLFIFYYIRYTVYRETVTLVYYDNEDEDDVAG